MPLIDTPFRRIAMDLVGPIHPASEQGHRYILTVIDFSTRYPVACPLEGISTEEVSEALVDIYSRMGIPNEILTDQDTHFTSDLMKEVGRLLSVGQMTTTPYHPICTGIIERLNGTLKKMLRRMCAEQPKQWDRYLPALLFAIREATHDSLGFSPFELLYGRTVRGPMAILKELMISEQVEPEIKSTFEYVLNLKDPLKDTCELAQQSLKESSERYKKVYDRKSKPRILEVNDKVLILRPSDQNKLMMQWKGPFDVIGVKGNNDYIVSVNGK